MKKNFVALALILFCASFISNDKAIAANAPKINFDFLNFESPNINILDYMEMRRGGSFRGTRPRSTQRQSTQRTQQTTRQTNPQKAPSFGGTRMTQTQARQKYGTPRRSETVAGTSQAGTPMNYNMNHYGGFSSGLMTGYMMGNMAWWMMASSMMYSRPTYVENEDGTIDVYPPTFNWGRLFFIFIIVFGIIYMIRAPKQKREGPSSDSYSSFR